MRTEYGNFLQRVCYGRGGKKSNSVVEAANNITLTQVIKVKIHSDKNKLHDSVYPLQDVMRMTFYLFGFSLNPKPITPV